MAVKQGRKERQARKEKQAELEKQAKVEKQFMKEMETGPYASRKFNLTVFALIALLVLIAYSNTFMSTFHFDDSPAIADNPYIKQLTMDNFLHLLNDSRPVVSLSLLLNYQLNGLNMPGWHAFNIGVHIANGILVYLLILRTLTLPRLAGRYGDRARWLALFCALLFAVHPVQTESVTYIITRSELLTAFFYLSTFLLFIRGALTRKFRYYLGAAVTAFCAAGAKQWAVTLPAMLFLYDFLFLSGGDVKLPLSRWKGYVLVMLSWFMIAKTTDLTAPQGSYGFDVPVITGTGTVILTAGTYLLTSLNVLWTYVRLMFLPYGQNIDYDYPLATTLFEFPTLLSLAGHIAVVAAAFWLYRKKGWLLVPFGVAWFYITISPVQSFVPLKDLIFEHRLYLPSLGIILAFVTGCDLLNGWLGRKREAGKAGPASDASRV
jgi:hypothetical protein